MPSLSPERGRSRSRHFAEQDPSTKQHSTPRRSISPRTASRTPPKNGGPQDRRNGVKGRSRSPRRTPSGSRSRGAAGRSKRYRERSYSRSRSRTPIPKSSKIVVEKLTKNVNEDHLREIFGAYGRIQEVDLPINSQFMTNRGTAYIIYFDTPDAESAIAHMHEAQVDGAVISVSIVLPRRKFSRSPPPARRGAQHFDRFENRGPSGVYRGGPPPPSFGGPAGGRYRSPPPRRASPPRRSYRPGGPRDRDLDTYRPRSYSRSRSRSRSLSTRSRSRTPVRRNRGAGRRESPPSPPRGGRRRRSPSYSSFSSYSERSRSRSRARYRRGRG